MLERFMYPKVYNFCVHEPFQHCIIKLTFEFLIVDTTGQIVDRWRSNTMNIAEDVPSKSFA